MPLAWVGYKWEPLYTLWLAIGRTEHPAVLDAAAAAKRANVPLVRKRSLTQRNSQQRDRRQAVF